MESFDAFPTLCFRPASDADLPEMYRIHCLALGPYITMIRGWDEVKERASFFDRFTGVACELIVADGRLAGVRRVEYYDDHICLEYLVLSPEHQRRGIGGRIVGDLLREARERGQPVKLRVLKVNPAKVLYERLGFVEVGWDEHFSLMEAGWNKDT